MRHEDMVAEAVQHRPPRYLEPLWLGGAAGDPRGEAALQSWRECLEHTPGGSIYVDPDLVLGLPLPEGGTPAVYARWRPGAGGADRLACLAALVRKTVRLQPIPGLPWRVALRSQRLVGNQLLGEEQEASAPAFVGELVRWLAEGGPDTACVLFEDLEFDAPLWKALANAGRDRRVLVFYPDAPQPHHWIDFPDRPADYWEQFSPKTRANLRRRARKGRPVLTRVCRPDAVAAFLKQAQEISRRSWQAKRLGVRIHNSPEERQFFESLAARGALRSYLLEQEGRPAAFLVGLQWQGDFLFEETGYDLELAGVSPGTVLFVRLLEDLVAHDPPRRFDFGSGDGDHKRLFANRQTLSGPVLLVGRRWPAVPVLWVVQARRRLVQGARAALKWLRIRRRLRQRYRR
jgi:CelD/BcsL family acetyltransferase involved in cellulose biosynthesis